MQRRHVVVLVGLAIGCGGGDPIAPSSARQPASPAARPGDFAVRGARVFDGERTLPDATVVVAGGRIAAVGDGAVIPPGTPVIDGAGKTLLPGLIDAHVHAFGDARRDALRFGVTAVLDMFGDPRALAEARRVRASLAPTDQADLWSAGMLATARGGHGTQFGVPVATVDAPAQAAGWVRDRVTEGSDYIKIVRDDFVVYGARRPTLGDAAVAALIEAAHARGKLAVMHVSAQEAARHALSAGIDGFVHVFQDAPADPALVALARRRGVFVIPTLSVIAGISGDAGAAGPLRDEALSAWLTPAQRQGLEARLPGIAARPALYARALESVRRLHAGGVTILAGTDAPNPSTGHGASMHDELERLVAAGLTPEQALSAATAAPARAFHLGDRGRIARGMRADLLLVDGDPTRDIRATRAIARIWKNGRPVERVRPPAPVAAPAPSKSTIGPISDFDVRIASRFGHGWEVGTDAFMGGKSTAAMRRVAGGADGSRGALEVTGEVRVGFAYPFAGCMFFPGPQPMSPVDLSGARTLRFQVKGDGRTYSALLMSGAAAGPPSMQTFVAGPSWREVSLSLADFRGADLTRVLAIGVSTGTPTGRFRILIDQVELR